MLEDIGGVRIRVISLGSKAPLLDANVKDSIKDPLKKARVM
jgi:hypothetical protein